MTHEKAVMCWSGGKDSALALHLARSSFEIVALLTTVTRDYQRISMHGVRIALLEQQAATLRIPLVTVGLSARSSNNEYEAAMKQAIDRFREQGVATYIFGDIFLEEVRRYREEHLLTGGLKGVFPLWGKNSPELARTFIRTGFRTVLCCVDTRALDSSFAGRTYDEQLLADLPKNVDPCGENGEFHSFVFDGPDFSKPIRYTLGEGMLREERFYYRDLVPVI